MSMSNRADDKVTAEDIHHPFQPIDIREKDPVKAWVHFENTTNEFVVWRLSPFGVELIESTDVAMGMFKDLKVTIGIGGQSSQLAGELIYSYMDKGKKIYCIRFVTKIEPQNGVERRTKQRWNASREFFPTGIASSPARFNDFIYFKVEDISFGGIRFSCSLRNKFLFQGMRIDSMVTFPMTSQVRMPLVIKNISIATQDGKDLMSVGATFDTTDKKLLEVISSYLLQFTAVDSPKTLAGQGFYVGDMSNSVDFFNVKTKEDYAEVLKLRFLANSSSKKLSGVDKPEEMADEFDSRSRIVVGKVRDKIVCCVRLAFHELDDHMEIEKYQTLPADFPRRDECIEVMRLCVHPDFSGQGILLALFRHLGVIVAQSRRRYIVTSCVEKLIPLYKKIGMRKTGVIYENPIFKGFPDHVMLADAYELIRGEGMNPLVWNMVWGDVYDYFEDYGIVDYTPLERVKIKGRRLLKPMANYMLKVKKRRKK